MRGSTLHQLAILLSPGDDVAVAREALQKGINIKGDRGELLIRDLIPPGHKFSLRTIAAGEPIRKYGQIIGFATRRVEAGEHVHSHNMDAKGFERDYRICQDTRPVDFYPSEKRRTFQGFRRPDGRVGTRNYIAVISTVNCSASVCRMIASAFDRDRLKVFPRVDGVIPILHKGGCAIPLDGEDHAQLRRTLAGIAAHPNVFGYLMVGLGCEVNQGEALLEKEGLSKAKKPSRFISIQQEGGISKTVEAGIREIERMLPDADACMRTEEALDKLIVGVECGGSDANSGITANPAVGWMADELVRHGGTLCLSEIPEIYGAEHLLTCRAKDEKVGEGLLERIRWWEEYARRNDAVIDNNPTPGNKKGGLTTIFEKSLGAVSKGGSTPLNAVYRYAETIDEHGLVVMDTPGYDPVSVTGMIAGGVTVVVFTTGCGSVFGLKPVPTIKVASNSTLYHKMRDDLDIDAGVIMSSVSVGQVGREIFEEVVAVASGKKTRSESEGVGEEEFAPWHMGAVL